MEIDGLNSKPSSRSIVALEQQRLSTSNGPAREHTIDFSTEHTNGRMFEQAVQNANKTHETSAPPNTIRHSDSKVGQDAKAGNQKPLILNDKDLRQDEAFNTKERKKKIYSGEEALIHALLDVQIDYDLLSDLSKDMIALKGENINTALHEKHMSHHVQDEIEREEAATIRLGHHEAGDEFKRSKRHTVYDLAIKTHQNLVKIEADFGNHIKVSVMREIDEADYGKAVTTCLFE